MSSLPQRHFLSRPASQKRFLDAGKFFRTHAPDQGRHLLQLDGLETQRAGHDYLSFLQNVQDQPGQLLISVADGHGPNGHLHSYVATRLLAKQLLYCCPLFQRHLQLGLADKETKITSLVHYCYQLVQNQMTSGQFPSLDRYSGSTMAMALVLVVGGKRYLIATNAGDSPILWSSGPENCLECSTDHNCDNLEAVKSYVSRLARERAEITKEIEKYRDPAGDGLELQRQRHQLQQRLKTLQPRPVYYSRINCSKLIWDMPEFLNDRGIPQPIKVYQYLGENQDQVVLDQENYEKISRYYPHGTQSRRVPPTYQREDGRTVAVAGREHENWGSCLAGNSQTLRGFGDLDHYPHHSAEPAVKVLTIQGPGRLLLASDGLTDLYYFQDLMAWFWKHSETSNLEDQFLDFLFQSAADDPNYPAITFEGVTYPKWDDVGGVLVEFHD